MAEAVFHLVGEVYKYLVHAHALHAADTLAPAPDKVEDALRDVPVEGKILSVKDADRRALMHHGLQRVALPDTVRASCVVGSDDEHLLLHADRRASERGVAQLLTLSVEAVEVDVADD